MGAEIQSNMHLPGYFSLHHQNKTFRQHYDLFSATRPMTDFDYQKEPLRQAILKHESIFRHQLRELHRLYKIQRDLMNEIRTKEQHERSSPFSVSFPRNRFLFKNGESLEWKCKKIQRRLLDLEMPADIYLDDNDEVREVSASIHQNSEATHGMSGNFSTQAGFITSGCNGDAFGSHLNSVRKRGMIDLNERVLVNENEHEECERSSFSEMSHFDNLHMPQVRQSSVKKKIFGVEISEGVCIPSSSLAACGSDQCLTVAQPCMLNFESSGNSSDDHASKCSKNPWFPILEKSCELNGLPSSESPSESSSPATVLVDCTAHPCKGEPLNTWPGQDLMSNKPGEKHLVNGLSVSKCFIDLNLCVDEDSEGEEEKALLLSSSPRKSCRAVEIDLEVPADIETETSGSESPESELQDESLDRLQDSKEGNKELISIAAEALVSISLLNLRDLEVNATSETSEASPIDPLLWLANVMSSREKGSVSMNKESSCHEDIVPDGMEYFEYKTLGLQETKAEEYSYNPQDIESPKVQNSTLRPQPKGHVRRGKRQRKEFQRDVLPSIASLSRNEVLDDIQIIEGLIRATGGDWKSSLTRRSMFRGRPRRGRKRVSGMSASDHMEGTAHPHALPLRSCRNLGLEEASLIGWGKKTRRPPRQRCLINNNTQLIASKYQKKGISLAFIC